MKIKKISLVGFKRFSKFEISGRKTNVLVGPNNAGKSTILDVLRLLNDCYKFASHRKPILKNQHEDGTRATYLIEHTRISIPLENVCKDYHEESALVTVEFDNKSSIVIRLHPEHAVEAYLRTDAQIPRSTAQFKKLFPLDIVIVPTLSPVEREEQFLQVGTVKKNENTRLASRNFRNIWYQKTDEEFSEFADLISSAWDGICILPPELVYGPPAFMQMFFEEHRIAREIYWSGFGFQVWMQIMTQVVRSKSDSIFVLDEPDIYLHSDLQRRLVRLLKDRFAQFFVATHSADIINECEPGDIVLVDNRKHTGKRIASDQSYQELFSLLGSAENAEFARFARAKRVVFFEGKDKRILKRFAKKLNSTSLLDDPDTAYLQAGGFEQWRRIKELNWTLTQVFGINVKIAAVFDRDYKCDAEIYEFEAQMAAAQIKCTVLEKKEIENYALSPSAIFRLVKRKANKKGIEFQQEKIDGLIDEVSESFREDVRGQILSKHLTYQKKKNPALDESTIIKWILGEFDGKWSDANARLALVPGKLYLSALSTLLQERHGISVSGAQIVAEQKAEEISSELGIKIDEIEKFLASD